MTGGAPRKAVVVFAGAADWPPLRLLRPGFRHCFAALATEGGWLLYEPLLHRTEVTMQPVPPGFDLAAWYRRQGCAAVETVVQTDVAGAERRVLPLRPYTCVEAVKRVIGLRAPRVFTPWQLFLLLTKKAVDTENKIGI